MHLILRLAVRIAWIGVLEPGQVLKFPSRCWQLRKVRAFHQLPVGFTHDKAEQKLTVIWGQGGWQGFLELVAGLLQLSQG